MLRMSLRLAAVAILTTAALPAGATAAPKKPNLGPLIEPNGGYSGQSKCDPAAKPGVVAFQRMVLSAYPGTGSGSISRACHVGGTSEHKEGRAWDWGVNVASDHQRKAANDLLAWLEARDRYGNEAAMARRTGIMYVIWNRRIWFPGSDWRTYCVQKKNGCFAPGTKSARHPHTDHVHFSFTWDGAKKKTSFWFPKRTWVVGAAAHPAGYGYWLGGGNASVTSFGAGHYGWKRTGKRAVAFAPSASGEGYWVLAANGQIRASGDAKHRGAPKGASTDFVSLASTKKGHGYWALAADGRVFAYGRSKLFGEAPGDGRRFVTIVRTPSGAGYWLFAEDGSIEAFGDAEKHGNAKELSGSVAAAAANPSGGYWIAGAGGAVKAFGAAQHMGGISEEKGVGAGVGMASTPTGGGYWLFTRKGKVFAFGDAQHKGSF